jgi:hypothetical protein
MCCPCVNGISGYCPSDEQTILGCCSCLKDRSHYCPCLKNRSHYCPCLKNERFQVAVPVWRTNGISLLSLSEGQISLLPCLKNKRYQGAVLVLRTDLPVTAPVWATALHLLAVPLGTMRVYVCVIAVRKWVAKSYFITIRVCAIQYAVSVRTTRSHLIWTGHDLLTARTCLDFSLRNTNVASFAVRVPAWKTGSCREGDIKFYSGSSEIAYWRSLFCVIYIFFKAGIVYAY